MKANAGDVIKLTKNVCYGTVTGLIDVKAGTVFHVSKRNDNNDGIEVNETLALNGQLGKVGFQVQVMDGNYEIIEEFKPRILCKYCNAPMVTSDGEMYACACGARAGVVWQEPRRVIKLQKIKDKTPTWWVIDASDPSVNKHYVLGRMTEEKVFKDELPPKVYTIVPNYYNWTKGLLYAAAETQKEALDIFLGADTYVTL